MRGLVVKILHVRKHVGTVASISGRGGVELLVEAVLNANTHSVLANAFIDNLVPVAGGKGVVAVPKAVCRHSHC